MRVNKIFQRNEIPYNVKKVNRLVLIIQKTSDQRLMDESLLSLFNYMKKVVDKNINNYLLLVRNASVREAYESEELVIECYLIMTKCIKKYKVMKGNNFYFYFNKSLSRTLYRLFEKEQKRNVERFESTNTSALSKLTNNMSCSVDGLVLDNLNFTEVEKLICMSKVKEQKREDFLIENPNVTNNMYYICMKNIKTKLINLQRHGEL